MSNPTDRPQKPRECELHRRIKGNSKCVKTWVSCCLYSMYIDHCPDFTPKTKEKDDSRTSDTSNN